MKSGWIRAWAAAIPVLGALGAVYVWKGGAASLFLFVLALSIAAIGAIAQFSGPRRVVVRRTWSPLAPFEGEDVEVTLHIRLEGGIPPLWLQVQDHLAGEGQEGGTLLFTGFKRNYCGTYRLDGVTRGLYTDGYTTASWGDVFGWFTRSRRIQGTDKLLVQPLPLCIAALDGPNGHKDGSSGKTISSPGYAPLWGSRLRAYEPGDPLKSIHWKITARRGELITRAQEEVHELPVCLILDTDPESYSAQEEVFEIAVSAAAAWLRRHSAGADEYYFCSGTGSGALKLSGREGLYQGLEILAQAQLVDKRLTASACAAEAWEQWVVPGQRITVITGRLSSSLVSRLLQMADAGAVLDLWCAGERGSMGAEGLVNGGDDALEGWTSASEPWLSQMSTHGIHMVPLLYEASVQMGPERGGRDHGIA